MSLLEKQLAELQAKKIKVEQFEKVLESLGNVTTHEEVLSEVAQFINNQIDNIENGAPPVKENSQEEFTAEEIVILKGVAQRIKISPKPVQKREPVVETAPTIQKTQPTGAFDDDEEVSVAKPQQPKNPPQKRVANQDKVAFAMAHRHLSDKRCSVTSSNGNQFQGKIVGTDAPFLVVQLDTGNVVNVPPEEVVIG